MLNLRAAGSLALAVTASIAICGPATAQTTEPVEAVTVTDANAAPADDAVRELTAWVVASGDNNDAPFIVIDKVSARVFVYDSRNQLMGEAPALVGIAVGDDSAPGVGSKKLAAIPVHDRTTPAGRFVAKIGMESGNHEVLWIDYGAAISLHPVVTANRKERRLQRLQSATPDDNRITFGCINVPPAFYKDVVRPLFNKRAGIVYILPETKPLAAVFPMNLQVIQASATTGGSR
jgi:hypothetical protein